ncbi:MAG: hypothetical protein PGN16_04030 [Sphingomonas phyllosphaerae]|uniref:hypothetical protein n=1 Tax=Sphingomonas phyllosphaerae TaxID=257003 RepID=UPI002FF955A5
MSDATPGPWIDSDGTTTGRVVTAPGQPKVRRNVAVCGGPNRVANARLIAAAPDLLEAVAAFIAYDEGDDDAPDAGVRMMIDYDHALTLARAAIAKARGEA